MSDLLRRSVKIQTVTPVVTASSAYAANNIVGAIFEIPSSILDGSAASKVQSILALSKAKADAALLLVLFGSAPAGTYTDKTAFSPSSADLALIQAVIPFGGTWKDFAVNSASHDKDLDVLVQVTSNPSFSKSMWGLLVATGTPTFGSTSDLTVKIALEQY